MLMSLGAFFCRISDPRYGGIYQTSIYTMNNIGANWPMTLSLWCVDLFTMKTCNGNGIQVSNTSSDLVILINNDEF